MSAFKIVGRITAESRWCYGKVGTQHKKRVYVTDEDFSKYAPATAKRWSDFIHLDVEAYKMTDDGKWERCELP